MNGVQQKVFSFYVETLVMLTYERLLTCEVDELRSLALDYGVDSEMSRDEIIAQLTEIVAVTEHKQDKKKIRKRRKTKRTTTQNTTTQNITEDTTTQNTTDANEDTHLVFHVPDHSDLYAHFAHVFDKFNNTPLQQEQVQVIDQQTSDIELDSEPEQPKMSRKKLKIAQRYSVGQLKQSVNKPDSVEWTDVCSSDPKLLVHLKAYRNVVPVPQHWQNKRRYLQGKRGVYKKPFELPDYIRNTGIMELRDTSGDLSNTKTRNKARDRMNPKLGKMDIDYQRLYDAFFKYQTKPYMTTHGDLYFEGKEHEAKIAEKKPGNISQELRSALNMPPLAPPPWLINMQRYGPPPSYPNLKIPGLNAPIPNGAQWGYHPGTLSHPHKLTLRWMGQTTRRRIQQTPIR
jgi:splicing factor 3B subunit 2